MPELLDFPRGNQPAQDKYMRDMRPGWTLYQGGLGCVRGDTLIDLADGSRERIDALAQRGLPVRVITTHGPVWCPPPGIGGRADFYRVTASDGRAIVVTAKHRFYVAGAWLRLSELRPGASVLCLPASTREHTPPASRLGCDQRDRPSWDAPCIAPHTGADLVITEISPAGHGDFYDINVPGCGHYLAHGFWNHNSGKTYASARKLLGLHAYNACPGLAVAPTYADLWRFVVPAIMAAAREWQWPCTTRRGDFQYLEVCGQPIYLISAEHPDRFAGFEVGHIWVDEGARIQQSLDDPLRDAPTQIRTRLRHPAARILHGMISTTPEGTDTWVQRDWFDKPLPEHRVYIGNTLSNAALPAEYIAALKASLPAELIDQYLSGIAVNFVGNRAHPTFSRTRHVRECPIVEGVPIHMGCDYNVSPMAWVAVQLVGDEVRVVDEVYLPDFAQVDTAVQAADAKGWGKQFIHFHPDKSAKQRSTVGDPEFTVMANTAKRLGWAFTGDPYGVNPPVDARINLLSRLILDATGKSRLVVSPLCRNLLEDLERTSRAHNGYDPGPQGKRGHALDGLGYVCWDTQQPLGKVGTSSVL